MPPKRSTRAPAQTRSTARTTSKPAAAPADSAPAAASKTVLARRTKPPTARLRPQADDVSDDHDNDEGTHNSTKQDQAEDYDQRGQGSGNDSDTLGISTRPARLFTNRNRAERTRPEEYVMTGGLGDGGGALNKKIGGGRLARTKKKPVKRAGADEEQARALEALRRRREEAMRGNAEGAQAEGDVGARGRRRESSLPPVPGTASRVRRASSSHWNPPPSAVKAQGTPAAESSVLALSKFKRRKRQPSLLRMMQQSDVEDGGDGSDPDDSALTLDYSLGDFEPDHESTPLNLRKGAAALQGSSEPRTSSSRKRKLDERERVEEVQVPRSSPPVDESLMKATSPEHLYSDASDLPDVVADTQPEPEQNEENTVEDTAVAQAVVSRTRSLTSPLSSLPAVPEPEEAPAKRPRRSFRNSVPSNSATSRRKTKNAVEDFTADPLSSSDLDSDTATETPVRARTTRKKAPARKQKTMSLSTATLQSLLPRRRKKPASRTAKKAVGTFEIPSSDVEDDEQESAEEEQSADEDELQRTPAPRKGKKRADVVAKASDSTVRGRKGSVVPEKGKGKRLSRTYGRRQRFSSDKENQDGDASIYVRSGGESEGEGGEDDVVETSEMRELAKSKELEAAARKFKEVDDWEMEFESVDMGGASASSPWR